MKRTLSLLLVTVLLLACASALGETAYEVLVNPTLAEWAEGFFTYNLMLLQNEIYLSDNIIPSANIIYNPAYVRSGSDGQRIADGGVTSEEGTFSVGMGAGIDDETMWYVTFTYNTNADREVIIYNTVNMLMAFRAIGALGDVESDLIVDLTDALLSSTESVAYELGDAVVAVKQLDNGQLLIMVDSLEFYNAFYKGSIANYTRL